MGSINGQPHQRTSSFTGMQGAHLLKDCPAIRCDVHHVKTLGKLIGQRVHTLGAHR
jgi:hypothetical protein